MKKFYQLHKKSLKNHKAKNFQELWHNLKKDGYQGLAVEMRTEFQKSAGSSNKFHAVFSTNAEDRHGEVVDQNWDAKSFKKNPVYLNSHNYDSIEHIIGKVSSLKTKGQLEGDITFALDNPMGELAYKLADGGFLNTSSVGFIPLEFSEDFSTITKSELLEISAVSVPANPEALFSKKEIKNDKKETPHKADSGKKEVKTTNNTDKDKKEQEPAEIKEKTHSEDEITKLTIKKTPNEKVKEVVRSEVDIRTRVLKKIYSATKLVCDELKVGKATSESKKPEKALINKSIRELLNLKKTLNK